MEAIVTDLTYVRVGKKWHYIFLILDLFNREIIGYSCGEKKRYRIGKRSLWSDSLSFNRRQTFSCRSWKKFDNQSIDDILNGFGITRSLSKKGFPYDNAVAESTYKFVKVEFVHQYQFKTLAQLRLELFDYVHWWNYLRLHGTLGMKHRYNFDNRDWQSEPLIMSSGLISLERQRN